MDNSKVPNPVKSCKVKLHREIAIQEQTKEGTATVYSKKEYLEEVKIPVDIKAKTKSDELIKFNLPAFEKPERYVTLDMLHPILRTLAKTFAVS